MCKIAILKNDFASPFDEEQYTVDLDRQFEGYEEGDLICFVRPFSNVPLLLEIGINCAGKIKFRKWEWDYTQKGNRYLHTKYVPEDFKATQEQIDTVNGLFSERIRFEGIKIPVGKTVMDICPLEREKEEERAEKRIYLM